MGVKLDVERWSSLKGMPPLLAALGADQGLTRLVGGVVRDSLLGLEGSDIDLATRLLPQEVLSRLRDAGIKAVPTGIDHGTITAVSDSQVVEITTLRRDVSTDGRRATVAFTEDWKEDAARRDFTINALSADPLNGDLFDYFGGLADLEARAVRFIGEPLERIAEDHLRILRFFRFQARFGTGAPDASALEACSLRANDLMALSRERIADELLKLLGLPDPSATVRLMIERGILKPVLPEIGLEGAQRLERLSTIEKAVPLPPRALVRLAALLPQDPELGARVAARLRLSKQQQKQLISALTPATETGNAMAYRLGSDFAIDRLALASELPIQQRVAAIRHLQGWTVPKLPINGGALIRRGVAEGPKVARMLREIENAWIAAGFPDGEAFEDIVANALANA
jgi:poly(A) polymerase